MKPLLLAIETGGTKIQLVLGTSAGDICYRYRTLVDREKGMQGILDKVLEAFPLLEQEAAKLGGKIECAGIGFGVPGGFKIRNGNLVCADRWIGAIFR